jgi:hypothetical protein
LPELADGLAQLLEVVGEYPLAEQVPGLRKHIPRSCPFP